MHWHHYCEEQRSSPGWSFFPSSSGSTTDFSLSFNVATDASNYGIGAVLTSCQMERRIRKTFGTFPSLPVPAKRAIHFVSQNIFSCDRVCAQNASLLFVGSPFYVVPGPSCTHLYNYPNTAGQGVDVYVIDNAFT